MFDLSQKQRTRLTYIIIIAAGAASAGMYYLLQRACPPFNDAVVTPYFYVKLITGLYVIMTAVLLWLRFSYGTGKPESGFVEGQHQIINNNQAFEDDIKPEANKSKCLGFIVLIILFGVVFRFMLFSTKPLLDNDIYRYYWEGRMQTKGVSPFRHAPNSPELFVYRDEVYKGVGYKYVPSCYPPLALFLFKTAYIVSRGDFYIYKAFIALFDVINVFLIFYLLQTFGMPLYWGVFYVWNPTVIKEFANSGHYDCAAITFLILTLILIAKNRFVLSAAAMAVCIALKPFALPIVPLLWKWDKKIIVYFMIIGVIVGVTFAPFTGEVSEMCRGIGIYTKYWEFNSGPFLLFKWIAGLFSDHPLQTGKKIFAWVLLLVVSGLVMLNWKKENEEHSDDGGQRRRLFAAAFVMGFALLFNPVVDPWYQTWMVPFVLIFPSAGWVYFLWAVNLSYMFYGKSSAPAGLLLLQFAPAIALWGWDIWRWFAITE